MRQDRFCGRPRFGRVVAQFKSGQVASCRVVPCRVVSCTVAMKLTNQPDVEISATPSTNSPRLRGESIKQTTLAFLGWYAAYFRILLLLLLPLGRIHRILLSPSHELTQIVSEQTTATCTKSRKNNYIHRASEKLSESNHQSCRTQELEMPKFARSKRRLRTYC